MQPDTFQDPLMGMINNLRNGEHHSPFPEHFLNVQWPQWANR
jgi:hypothetical protein